MGPGRPRDHRALITDNSRSDGDRARSAPETPSTQPQHGIQSVELAAGVLRALESGRGPLTLSETARRSGLHPAKAHRYLVSLVRSGLAAQDSRTGLYDLGPAARHLGVEALRRTDLVSVASAYAVRLRDETGHTVNVAVWSDGGPLIVRWDSGTHAIPITVRVGSILPLLDSAVGLVFLSYLPRPDTAAALAAQQERHETQTLDGAAIDKLIKSVRRAGYATSLNRMIYGLAAVSAPVFDANGALALVLGVAVPARMIIDGDPVELCTAIVASAQNVSIELGYRQP